MEISSAAAPVASELLEALGILSDATVKICSWLGRPKTILEKKKCHISLGYQQSYCLQVFSKTLVTAESRLKGW